jgi:hypothetical protein
MQADIFIFVREEFVIKSERALRLSVKNCSVSCHSLRIAFPCFSTKHKPLRCHDAACLPAVADGILGDEFWCLCHIIANIMTFFWYAWKNPGESLALESPNKYWRESLSVTLAEMFAGSYWPNKAFEESMRENIQKHSCLSIVLHIDRKHYWKHAASESFWQLFEVKLTCRTSLFEMWETKTGAFKIFELLKLLWLTHDFCLPSRACQPFRVWRFYWQKESRKP